MTYMEVDLDEAVLLAELEPVRRLGRDLKRQAQGMSRREVRFLVDWYYQAQRDRIRFQGRVNRAAQESDEPATETIAWLMGQSGTIENQVKSLLGAYAQAQPVGAWLMSLNGIGPVLAAGLLANFDITRSNTAGGWWRYAGLDPSLPRPRRRTKGEEGHPDGTKYNRAAKVLAYKCSLSFVMQGHREADFYCKLYRQRKEYEVAKNLAGDYADIAHKILEDMNIKVPEIRAKNEAGFLADGHIDARARRWTAKLFLSHMHTVSYFEHHKRLPPKPFVVDHLGHKDIIPPPNMEMMPGLKEAYIAAGWKD